MHVIYKLFFQNVLTATQNNAFSLTQWYPTFSGLLYSPPLRLFNLNNCFLVIVVGFAAASAVCFFWDYIGIYVYVVISHLNVSVPKVESN